MKSHFVFGSLLIASLLGGPATFSQDVTLSLDPAAHGAEIPETLYGIFYEDINFAADGGLYPEQVKNRSFEFPLPKTGWAEPGTYRYGFNPGSGVSHVMKYGTDRGNKNFLRVEIARDTGYRLINEGFRGIGVHKGKPFRFSFMAALGKGEVRSLKAVLRDTAGVSLGQVRVPLDSRTWKTYETSLLPEATCEKARLEITFEGSGTIDLDMISLFPEDTWEGRRNGLRKDLVQLLYDMDPGFLRFPGGCIVEGRNLARRYQWKKTVGPVEERELLINRWNMEFAHRPTPDYFQSFGLGFFEYFQLAEDLGAEPMPIVGCGMACQFNTAELVPLDQLEPYVQDALDLIEFANGGTETPWGSLRAQMGHPEPFNMKYIGIGNEQWGPEYFERYDVFVAAIAERYPDIVIVSTSGPFPEGDFYDYGWEQLKARGAALVDEHYYQSPEWFLENSDRYDQFDRNGPKVFAGEYAAQSVGTTSPENRNNWRCALAEAAFMTGLERNADVVVMTSYAPLMAHADGWQWTPDLIWFNNLESYGSANYQVQKLFATNRGTHLLDLRWDNEHLNGRGELYGAAAWDATANEVILKLVHTGMEPLEVTLPLEGVEPGAALGWTYLQSDDLQAVNSFGEPRAIWPRKTMAQTEKGHIQLELKPSSVNVIRIPITKA